MGGNQSVTLRPMHPLHRSDTHPYHGVGTNGERSVVEEGEGVEGTQEGELLPLLRVLRSVRRTLSQGVFPFYSRVNVCPFSHPSSLPESRRGHWGKETLEHGFSGGSPMTSEVSL